MTYWEKVGCMNNLILFAKEWKTIKDVKEEFNLTANESWKLFRAVIKVYDEFEYRDVMMLKAGCPIMFRSTEKALLIALEEVKK